MFVKNTDCVTSLAIGDPALTGHQIKLVQEYMGSCVRYRSIRGVAYGAGVYGELRTGGVEYLWPRQTNKQHSTQPLPVG